MLGVHGAESAKISVSEEDYDHLHLDELGALAVSPEQHNHLDELDDTTDWTALGNDTLNLATTDNHLTGTKALTFDKVNGDADTVFAGIQKTITTIDMGEMDLHDVVQTVCYLSSIAQVDYVFVRIGTSSANYNEWRVQDTELAAGDFQILGFPIGLASQAGSTGTGVNWGAISYIAVGVAFDNQANTLSGIIFDQLGIFTGSHTTASIGSEVSTSVSSPNVNVKKWGSQSVTLNAGNSDTGTLRVVLASDQNIFGIEDAAADANPTGVILMSVRDDEVGSTAIATADNDLQALRSNQFGELKVTQIPDSTSEFKYAVVNVASSGNNTVQAAAASGVKIRVLAAWLISAGTVNVRWESGADGTALTGEAPLVANTGYVLPFNPAGWFETADATLLNLELSAGVSVDGSITYVEI